MRRLNVLALFLFIGGLVWVFILPKEKAQKFQHTVGSWFSPFTKTGAKVQDAIAGVTEEVRTPAQLKQENEQLQVVANQFHIQQQAMEALEKENADLRAALEFRKHYGFKLIPAEIINRTRSAWYREAKIDKGLRQKIVEQTPVLAAVLVTDGGVSRYEGALVGKIGNVSDEVSTVVFLTDENCRVAATVKGLSNVRGILMGARSSVRESPDLRLRFLKSEPVLEPGRQVVSDGIGEVFPFGILLGEVTRFESGEGTGEASVRPAVDFNVLRHVFVLQPSEDSQPPLILPKSAKKP